MQDVMIALFCLLPIAFWWRFKDTPLDRDYCPYAYPAWMKTGYLENGHIDIKPPLIHWLYKIWLYILPPFLIRLKYSLRLMPLVGSVLSVWLLGRVGGWQAALVTALLFSNPYMWPFMANTEWIGVTLLAVVLNLSNPYLIQFTLGVMWLANLKNVPLALFIGLYLSGASSPTDWGRLLPGLTQLVPLSLTFGYMALTGRLRKFWLYVFVMMVHFGKVRKVLANIDLPLIKKALGVELLPFIACMDWRSPWAWTAFFWMFLCVASKQIVPHHLIMLIPLLALSVKVTPFLVVAFALTWFFRNLIIWKEPAFLYPATFGGMSRSGHQLQQVDYGQVLNDAKPIIEWIKCETKPDETILVCGIDNNIYTDTGRRAHTLVLPEYGKIDGEPPRIAIHCHLATAVPKEFYQQWGYKPKFTSPLGTLTVMERAI